MSDLCFSSLPLPSASPSSNSCPPAGDEDSRPSALPHSLTPLHSSSSGRVALLGLEREPPPCSRQAANTHCMVPAAVWAAGENSQGAGCRCSPELKRKVVHTGSHGLTWCSWIWAPIIQHFRSPPPPPRAPQRPLLPVNQRGGLAKMSAACLLPAGAHPPTQSLLDGSGTQGAWQQRL